MKIAHAVHFTFDLALRLPDAVAFVQDVRTSLCKASFLHDMQVTQVGELQHVRASIPINAALFGQRELSFESVAKPEPRGATLSPLPFSEPRLGWAEVAGRAAVSPLPSGSRVTYDFDITIHLDLPEPEKWGGRALLKMIHFTAQRVLESIAAEFPRAVQMAAAERVAAGST
ncbi:DUF3809 domain-containing protein [Truepera radiovictrix]|uniref:Coenzyme Q-binding protein COQ10 START domain-containing protein n=1 Tax=Truepera radiovictrix (strain DSM 17093 / CIP 108686 / LMG 22925 / RQ-24) TaxID=649638 RepID=D7CW49_TRURR|nr:DUF3809 domain-containing protein [Truepera radiovictrix]ADI14312.1 conserved hypothetical protein [Truepera radiovictrix DSM 17093]WMT57132.1 DUF3809 domain-containing protein [Truepera radiovictrix]